MPDLTPNLGLKKPIGTETVSRASYNENLDIMDTNAAKKADYTHGYAADSGTANAYIVALTPAPSAYAAGLGVRFKALNANTGASTINVNGLGIKNIKMDNGSDPPAGVIAAGAIVTVVYDGTNFQIVATGLTAHLADEVHEEPANGIHGLRVVDGKLEYYNGSAWKKVGGGVNSFNLVLEKPKSMPNNRHYLCSGQVDGKIYTFGGNNGTAGCNVNEVYDPIYNNWVKKANMPTARELAGGETIDGKIYVIGGRLTGTAQSANEMYDPATNTWTSKQAMPTARYGFACVAIGTIIYTIGGWQSNQTVHEAYDTVANSWSTKATFTSARGTSAGVNVNGKIYILAGIGGTTVNEMYDPVANTYTTKTAIPQAFNNPTAVANGTKIYLTGGDSQVALVYDTDADTWDYISNLPTARRAGVTSQLIDGKWYVIGGSTAATAVVEYHIVTDVFDYVLAPVEAGDTVYCDKTCTAGGQNIPKKTKTTVAADGDLKFSVDVGFWVSDMIVINGWVKPAA